MSQIALDLTADFCTEAWTPVGCTRGGPLGWRHEMPAPLACVLHSPSPGVCVLSSEVFLWCSCYPLTGEAWSARNALRARVSSPSTDLGDRPMTWLISKTDISSTYFSIRACL